MATTAMTTVPPPPPPPPPPLTTVLRVRRRKRRRATSGGGGEGAGAGGGGGGSRERHEHDHDDHDHEEEESRGTCRRPSPDDDSNSSIPSTLRIISSLNSRRQEGRTNKESSCVGNDRGGGKPKRPRTGSRYPFDPETDERLSNLLHESTYISRRPRPRPRPIDAAEPSRRRSSGGVGFGCYSQECSDEEEYYGSPQSGDGIIAKDTSTTTAAAPGCGTGETTSERRSSQAYANSVAPKVNGGIGGHGGNSRKRKATRSVLFRRVDSGDAATIAAKHLASSSSGAVRVVECSLSDDDSDCDDDGCPRGDDGGVASNKRHRRHHHHHHHHGHLRVVGSPQVRSAAEVFAARTTSPGNGRDGRAEHDVTTSSVPPPAAVDEENKGGGDEDGDDDYVYDIFYVAEDGDEGGGGRGGDASSGVDADAGKGNNENRDTAGDGDDEDVVADPAFFWGETFGRVEDGDGDDDNVGRGAEFHGADGAASGSRRESSSMTVELRGGYGYLDDLDELILGNDRDVDFGDCPLRDGRDHDHDHDSDVHDSNDEGYDGNDYPDEQDDEDDGDDPFDVDGDYGDVSFASSSDEDGDDGGRRRMRMRMPGGDVTSWKHIPGGGAGARGWSIDQDDDHYGGDALELFDDEDGCGYGGGVYLGGGAGTGRGFFNVSAPSSSQFAYDPDLDDDGGGGGGGGGDHDDFYA